MKQFVVREERARLELMRDRGKRERGSEHRWDKKSKEICTSEKGHTNQEQSDRGDLDDQWVPYK